MQLSRAFGPVPSRRLGRSLGINNIPPTTCSYSCVYCQLGRTSGMAEQRAVFYHPEELLVEVREKIAAVRQGGESIDYLSLVPDGEPTLDMNLGVLIRMLKETGYPVAVITNSSLLTDPLVREELGLADWVSVKVDTVREPEWHRINRPHRRIRHREMLEGIETFASGFTGRLASETMLVRGVNDDPRGIEELAAFLDKLRPEKVWLGIPIRPPAENWVTAPTEDRFNTAFQILVQHGLQAEHLIGYEGNAFAFTGNVQDDLLGITAVHPMREDAVDEYLRKAGGKQSDIQSLLDSGRLIRSIYRGNTFYLRRFPRGSAVLRKPTREFRSARSRGRSG
jgi:wyosine [tRNA(Phe)-imidazoG37] synthetase (radical SAM superfamily)